MKGKAKTKAKVLAKTKTKAKAKARVEGKAKAKARHRAAVVAGPTAMVSQEFLLPHLLFHHLFTYNKPVFDRLFIAGEPSGNIDNLRGWWKGVAAARDPRIQDHPCLDVEGWHDIFCRLHSTSMLLHVFDQGGLVRNH